MNGEIVYRIDGDGRFVYFNAEWDAFALANDAPELGGGRLLGQRLTDFITGVEARHLTQVLMRRASEAGGPIEVSLRCDGPDVRRTLAMVIECIPGGVEFRTRPQRIEPRIAERLFDRRTPRAPDFVTMCAWCSRIKLGSMWAEVEEAVHHLGLLERHQLPGISHGICPSCAAGVTSPV